MLPLRTGLNWSNFEKMGRLSSMIIYLVCWCIAELLGLPMLVWPAQVGAASRRAFSHTRVRRQSLESVPDRQLPAWLAAVRPCGRNGERPLQLQQVTADAAQSFVIQKCRETLKYITYHCTENVTAVVKLFETKVQKWKFFWKPSAKLRFCTVICLLILPHILI